MPAVWNRLTFAVDRLNREAASTIDLTWITYHCAQLASGNLKAEDCIQVEKLVTARIQSLSRNLRPWASQEEAPVATTVATMSDRWTAENGDQNDPATQAKIAATVRYLEATGGAAKG